MKEYTAQEIIEALEYLISDDCPNTQHDYKGEIRAAVSALEKQVPTKPKNKRKVGFGIVGGICSKCEKKVYSTVNTYCHVCGQALDWSDE